MEKDILVDKMNPLPMGKHTLELGKV